jgi:hypothetical protein
MQSGGLSKCVSSKNGVRTNKLNSNEAKRTA